MKKVVAILLCILISFPFININTVNAVERDAPKSESPISADSSQYISYENYLENHKNAEYPDGEIPVHLDSQAAEIENYSDYSGLFVRENEALTLKIPVEKAGLYQLEIKYVASKDNYTHIETELFLNGEIPFEGAQDIIFTKVFYDDGKPTKDINGNDIRPEQKELTTEQTDYIHDSMGYLNSPYYFYLNSGENEISFNAMRGSFLITGLSLKQTEKVPSYEAYLAKNPAQNTTGQFQKIDGESPQLKSHSTLYAESDRSTASVDPAPGSKYILNYFGGESFNRAGQWVQYQFEAPETGYYNLSVKYKQNYSNGTTSYRRIYVDGEVLFEDLNAIGFDYDSKWRNKTLGDKDAYKIYLDEGKHTVRLYTVLGEYGEINARIEASVKRLNEAYRASIMYLSSTPDINRDYDVQNNLSDVLEIFSEQVTVLNTLSEDIIKITGNSNDKTAVIERLAYQLEDFLKEPEKYPRRLEQFRNNISSFSSIIYLLSLEPLGIDYLIIHSPDTDIPKAKAGFFAEVKHAITNFIASFSEKYAQVGDTYVGTERIEVWTVTGRAQSQVLKRLIDDKFSPKKNIGVDLKLVRPEAILPAIVAGIGPDAVIQVGNSDPANYAFRGAIYDVAQFPDYEAAKKQFTHSSTIPLTVGDKVYGLPETESFNMMFYRKDVLDTLGIAVPQTWKETLYTISELQKNNFMFGFPQAPTGTTGGAATSTFGMLLYQFGGDFHRADSYLSDLDSEQAINAFTFLTDMYINYKLLLTYDILTRFRSGEMPIVITDYGFFNTLQITAPEIRGMWDFTLVPGMAQADGTIDRSVIGSGSACMILESTKKEESAWEFIKWWTGTETQVQYGVDMELLLGASARVPTANIEALKQLPWSVKDAATINEQREWVKAIESVPGGYFTSRHMENAFRKVVISSGEPRETIRSYVKIINKEIETKCDELKVPLNRTGN